MVCQHGGDLNATDHTGQTALHWCAVWGAIQVTELLLQEGAKVDAADIYGYQVSFSSLGCRVLYSFLFKKLVWFPSIWIAGL